MRRLFILVVSLFTLLACGSGDGATADGGSDCDDSWKPANFDPCAFSARGPLMLMSDALLDTSSGELTIVGGTPTDAGLEELNLEVAVALLYVESLEIGAGATLRVTGEKPLLLASAGDIAISGALDVSADVDVGAAGSNPSLCEANAPTAGGPDLSGSGGGGGGALGALGGDGELGDENDANMEFGTAGIGGTQPSNLTALRGGCAGAKGGDDPIPNEGGAGGVGGAGGGAIQLSAQGELSVTASGAIDAGGGGGATGNFQDGGGGGGGSGGVIWLDAPTISVAVGGAVTANGGGGGGGADGFSNGMNGADATRSFIPAAGGQSAADATTATGSASEGGRGGVRNDDAGNDSPAASNRGAGGGGGSVGVIVVDRLLSVPNGAIVSPAASVLP